MATFGEVAAFGARRCSPGEPLYLRGHPGTQFKNNYFTEMCCGSEEGSYLRLIDFVYHSTLGLRVIKKKKKLGLRVWSSGFQGGFRGWG